MFKTYSLADVLPVYRKGVQISSGMRVEEKQVHSGISDTTAFDAHSKNTGIPLISPTRPNDKRLLDEAVQDYISYVNFNIERNIVGQSVVTGKSHLKKELICIGDRIVYPRGHAIAREALITAEYKCELDRNHRSFISKAHGVPYTEPHHLVPLAFADHFDVSLDVVENIVSLCSNCHNEVHYGKDSPQILMKLYKCRKDALEQVGIKITLEQLLWMYTCSCTNSAPL